MNLFFSEFKIILSVVYAISKFEFVMFGIQYSHQNVP